MNPYCPPDCVDARVMSRVIAAASDLALVVDQQGVIRFRHFGMLREEDIKGYMDKLAA